MKQGSKPTSQIVRQSSGKRRQLRQRLKKEVPTLTVVIIVRLNGQCICCISGGWEHSIKITSRLGSL